MTTSQNPFTVHAPDQRWAPSQSQLDAFANAHEKLLPPLVHEVRQQVATWREGNYAGASATSRALLDWWFHTEHPQTAGDNHFQFYFAQREAIESIIYLYEVEKYQPRKHGLRTRSAEPHGPFRGRHFLLFTSIRRTRRPRL